MGVQFSRTIKKIFLENGGDPASISSVHLVEGLDVDTERLDLRSAGIVNIPEEMMQLKKLTWLQLSQNLISTLPPSIGSLEHLKTLRLFSNMLKELPPEIGMLSKLSTLDAGKNNITNLCPEICQCTSLTELNLQWNHIEKLPEGIGKLQNLKILNLYINKLTELPDSIGDLLQLETFDLAHNRIIQFPSVLGSLTNLTALNLVGNGCDQLPDALAKLKSLRKIDIRCNYIEELPEGLCELPYSVFQARNNLLKSLPPNFGNLKELMDCRLETNRLTKLPDSIGDLPNLRILLLYENCLISVPGSLGRVTQLIELDLTSNELLDLPDELSSLQCLESLFLSKNKIEEVPSCIAHMESLQQLDFVNNRLTSLPDKLWASLPKLGKLSFNLNGICALPTGIMYLQSLIFLELACNFLEEIPEEICELANLNFLNVAHNRLRSLPESLSKMVQLKKLYVSFNNLGEFKWPESYSNLTGLKEFVCAGNKQIQIPPFLYTCPLISYLDLSGNQITEIQPEIKNIENLNILILSHNQIESIPVEFTELRLLSEIDLAGNKLKTLPAEIGQMELLADIDVSGNEIETVPDLRALVNLLQLKIAHNRIDTPPRVDANTWTSTEGNINARVKRGKYATEFDSLFKTKLRTVVSKRLSRWVSEDSVSTEFDFAWAETRGRRPDQQDAITIVKSILGQNLHYVGLYDGHGGTVTSEVSSSVLHQIFIDLLNRLNVNSFTPKDLVPLFSEAFGLLQGELTVHSVNDGSAANVIFLTQNKIYCANAGDSRAILIRSGAAVALSEDHKPEDLKERKRIEEAGGFVTESKRVNGVLALSRALGDCDLYPAITCEPDVRVEEILPEDSFIIMACDGVWDMLSNEEVAELVRDVETPEEVVVLLRDAAYTLGSTDNISVVAVKIQHLE